jgi:hypothetical protein
MIVNSTEVQNNFGKYPEPAARQKIVIVIVITKNGRAGARLDGNTSGSLKIYRPG